MHEFAVTFLKYFADAFLSGLLWWSLSDDDTGISRILLWSGILAVAMGLYVVIF